MSTKPKPRRDDSFALVFLGNAFEAPPRRQRAHQRPLLAAV